MSKPKVIKSGTQRTVVEKHILPTIEELRKQGVLTQQAGEQSFDPDDLGSTVYADENTRQQMDSQASGILEQQAIQMKQEAQAILKKAETEVETFHQSAREKGYAEGLVQAKQESNTQLSSLVANLKEMYEKISNLKNTILKQNEQEIINLSLEISRKIIGAELFLNPKSIVTVIKAALETVDLTEKITVRVNPDDHSLLMSNLSDELKQVWLVADSQVQTGGAIIDTESGTFDAQIETQLMEIEKNLKKDIIDSDQ